MTETVTFLLGVFIGFLLGQIYQVTRREGRLEYGPAKSPVDIEVMDEDEKQP